MNKLADSTSPYLLQHANNPVNWYPWGPEALQKAKDENKVRDRSVSLHTVDVFARCILSGQSCVLPNGTEITWERIPGDQAIQLPPPIVLSSPG